MRLLGMDSAVITVYVSRRAFMATLERFANAWSGVTLEQPQNIIRGRGR